MRFAFVAGIGLALIAAGALAERATTLEPARPAPGGQTRIALVMGNGAYRASPLRNPVNDAQAIGRALAEAGFRVTLIENATEGGMRRAIRAFGDALAQSGGVGLFYYAGHAMQVRGRNFLIPIQADIQREDEVEDQAVDANLVLSKMDSAKNALNIVILDACRNNPFSRSFRSSVQGLAQMDAPSGTLIAFATAPGSVAADGDGKNGLYTTHLLRAMREPGLAIEQLFKQVRIDVTRETGDRQVPWESSSLKGNFYFLPPDPNRVSEAQRAREQQAVARAVSEAEARAAQERAKLEAKLKDVMAQLLARQRAELDEERMKRGAPAADPEPRAQVASAPPGPPTEAAARAKPSPAKAEPAHVASAAPGSAAAASGARGVKPGDHWVYRTWRKAPANRDELVADVKTGRRGKVAVDILGVQDGSILERRDVGKGVRIEWVHGPGLYLQRLGRLGDASIYALSPYLLEYQVPAAGATTPITKFQRLRNCSDDPRYDCSFRATIVGRESVTVPAGTFDALRIDVEQIAYHNNGAARRVASFWYAEAVKRHVKATWHKVEGVWQGQDGVDELVLYTPG